jgi:hypothetical protein
MVATTVHAGDAGAVVRRRAGTGSAQDADSRSLLL